jgi:2-polyprenyl-3-methyl-5-hydroxy-6-metoxy-1,4-benzoquinol methylase
MKTTNPDAFASFYNDTNLNFDYYLVEKGYNQFKAHFNGKKALELGPASGYMTKFLVNDFDKLTLVEGSKTLLDQIPEYSNVDKVHCLFEEYEPNQKFDTIVMNHVLEHIENPVDLLKRISEWLSETGVLIIGVPNAKSFHRLAAVKMGLLKSEYELNNRDKELGHFRVYDFESLINDAKLANYKVQYQGGVFVKFLSNAQIVETLSKEAIDAYFELGEVFKENAAEIYVVLTK